MTPAKVASGGPNVIISVGDNMILAFALGEAGAGETPGPAPRSSARESTLVRGVSNETRVRTPERGTESVRRV